MATREDIEQPVTLEFGGEVEPAIFERLVVAFFDVVDGIEITSARWAVEVKKGSQLVGLRPLAPNPVVGAQVARALAEGVEILEHGAERPRFFSDKALKGVRTIARLSDSAAHPRIWADFAPRKLTARAVAHVNELVEGVAVEYGSVSGRLQTVSDRDGFRFVVYDELTDHAVNCTFKEEDTARVMGAFRQRVEVYGDVRYRKDGRATTVAVADFDIFPPADALPKVRDVRGILRNFRRDG